MPSKKTPHPANPQAVPMVSARPLIGMHGERIDWLNSRSQLYHLGNGARSFDPMLQCFLSKDPYSPFSVGGINPYAFCAGDPVNRTDHSGYMSVSAGIGLGLGILGIILSIVTFGITALIGAGVVGLMLSATSALLGMASAATGIAAAILEDSDPELARTLGWVSLGLGIASALVGLIGPALTSYAKATGRLVIGRLKGNSYMRSAPARAARGHHPAQPELDFLFHSRYRDGSIVTTHGTVGQLQNADGLYLPPGEWADELAHLPAYQAHPQEGPLYLLSCGAGRYRGVSNAARIAETLDREVLAFDAAATYTHQLPLNRPQIFSANASNWSKLVRFSPQ